MLTKPKFKKFETIFFCKKKSPKNLLSYFVVKGRKRKKKTLTPQIYIKVAGWLMMLLFRGRPERCFITKNSIESDFLSSIQSVSLANPCVWSSNQINCYWKSADFYFYLFYFILFGKQIFSTYILEIFNWDHFLNNYIHF